ncbi:MAG: FAD binding domain-containing protein [Spirochaetaceae bacterium]
MSKRAKPVYVYYPDNLGEFLQLRRRKPDALVYAGGTFILKGIESRPVALPQEIISLQWVEELKRVSRTDRYVELGASCSLSRIVEVGRNVLPVSFIRAFSTMVPLGVRNLATIGGNLCVAEHVLTVYPLLLAVDGRVELRRHGNARWIPAGRLRDESGGLTLETGEIVTRVRIPPESWNVQVFTAFGRPYIRDSDPVVFAGLAKTDTGIVDDFRMVFSAHDRLLFRDRELEADLVGRRAPLPRREAQTFMRRLQAILADWGAEGSGQLSSLQRRRIAGSARKLIARMSA